MSMGITTLSYREITSEADCSHNHEVYLAKIRNLSPPAAREVTREYLRMLDRQIVARRKMATLEDKPVDQIWLLLSNYLGSALKELPKEEQDEYVTLFITDASNIAHDLDNDNHYNQQLRKYQTDTGKKESTTRTYLGLLANRIKDELEKPSPDMSRVKRLSLYEMAAMKQLPEAECLTYLKSIVIPRVKPGASLEPTTGESKQSIAFAVLSSKSNTVVESKAAVAAIPLTWKLLFMYEQTAKLLEYKAGRKSSATRFFSSDTGVKKEFIIERAINSLQSFALGEGAKSPMELTGNLLSYIFTEYQNGEKDSKLSGLLYEMRRDCLLNCLQNNDSSVFMHMLNGILQVKSNYVEIWAVTSGRVTEREITEPAVYAMVKKTLNQITELGGAVIDRWILPAGNFNDTHQQLFHTFISQLVIYEDTVRYVSKVPLPPNERLPEATAVFLKQVMTHCDLADGEKILLAIVSALQGPPPAGVSSDDKQKIMGDKAQLVAELNVIFVNRMRAAPPVVAPIGAASPSLTRSR